MRMRVANRNGSDLQSMADVSTDMKRFSRSLETGTKDSIIDQDALDTLLTELYDRWHWPGFMRSDSDPTEYSSTSDAVHTDHARAESKSHVQLAGSLQKKTCSDLKRLVNTYQQQVNQSSARLVRLLKARERLRATQHKHCDLITAVLQASSEKRREDMRIRFSLDPNPGQTAFEQWRDAMGAVARQPCGIPDEFRHKVWQNLAKQHIEALRLDWPSIVRFAFNDRANPDDSKLGLQIVKDLHRTGSTGFSGQENEEDRAVLKRVLLAFARWNKQIGYCQGFNVIAALLLEVTERSETDALQLMIYLVDHVLPDGYFNPQLRALSVDMAVFRELLKQMRPRLARHLDKLQQQATSPDKGGGYEPPLLNVFSMQWLVTLYATCLPKPTVLRLWDVVLLEGSEVLLRAALALWTKLQSRVLKVSSADEFYTHMGGLCQELMSGELITTEELIKAIYSLGPFPMPQLADLREKYAFNITPFTGSIGANTPVSESSSRRVKRSSDNSSEIGCFSAVLPTLSTPHDIKALDDGKVAVDESKLRSCKQPSLWPDSDQVVSFADLERTTTDLCALGLQYRKLRQRQQQARIIINNAFTKHNLSNGPVPKTPHVFSSSGTAVMPGAASPAAMNHLMLSAKYGRLCAQRRKSSQSSPTDRKPSINTPDSQNGSQGMALITKSIDLSTRELETTSVRSTTSREMPNGEMSHDRFSPISLSPMNSPRTSRSGSDAGSAPPLSPTGLKPRSPQIVKTFNPFPTRGQPRRRGGQLDLYKKAC